VSSAAVIAAFIAAIRASRQTANTSWRRGFQVLGGVVTGASMISALSVAVPVWNANLVGDPVPSEWVWAWLTVTLTGLGVGAALIVGGLASEDPPDPSRLLPLVGGWLLAVFAWAFGWVVGLDSVGSFEVVTVPAGVAAGAIVWLARRRGADFGVPIGAVALATVTPSLIEALQDPRFTEPDTWWRVLAVIAVAGIVAVWPIGQPKVVSSVAVAMALLAPLLSYVVEMAQRDLAAFPEVFVFPCAAAVAAVTAWVIEPRDAAQWWRSVQWPLGVAAGVSVVMAVVEPFATGGVWERDPFLT
jgi:hypothetical protein